MSDGIKTKLTFEYDHSEPIARNLIHRILKADEAWFALWKIRENCQFIINHPTEKIKADVFYELLELIDRTNLEEIYE